MPNKYPTFGANYYSSLYSKYLPQYAGTEDEYAVHFDSWWENMYNKYQGDDQAGSTYFESLSNSNINPFIHMDDTIYPPVNQPDTGNVAPDFWGEYPKTLDYINKSWNEHGYNQYWNVNDYIDYLKNTMSGLGEKEIEKRLIDIGRDENPFNEFVTNNWYNDETAWGRVYQSEWDKFSQLNANADIWSTAQAGGYTANKIFNDWFNTNVKQKYATDVSGYNPKTWYSLQNISPLELDIYGDPKQPGGGGNPDTGGEDNPDGGSIEPDPFDVWLRPQYDLLYKKYRTTYSDMSDEEFKTMFDTWWRGRYDEYEGKADTAGKYFSDLLQSANFNPFGEEFGEPGAGEDSEPHPDLPPGPENPGTINAYDATQYQIAVPDELTQAAQNGYGSQWMRAAFETAMSPNIQEYGNTVRSIQNSRGAGGLRSGFGEKDQQMAEYQMGLLGLGAKSDVAQQDYEYRQASLGNIDNINNYNKATKLSIDQWNAQQEYSNRALSTYDTQQEKLRKALEEAKETEFWGDIIGGIGSFLPYIL